MYKSKKIDPSVISKAALIGTKIRGRGMEPDLRDDDKSIVRGALSVLNALNADATKAAIDGDAWLTKMDDYAAGLRLQMRSATSADRSALTRRLDILMQVRSEIVTVNELVAPYIDQDAYTKAADAADAARKAAAEAAKADKAAKDAADKAAKDAADKAAAEAAKADKAAAEAAKADKAAAEAAKADKAAKDVVDVDKGGASPSESPKP